MRKVIDHYIEAYNSFDVDGMLQLMAKDVVFENFSGDNLTAKTVGIDELRQMAQQAAALFKSRKQTILGYRADESKAFVDIQFEGTFAVDLPNGIKAGQTISIKGRSEFHFSKDLITYLGDFS